MLAHYSRLIDRSPTAAFLSNAAQGIVHANAAAREWTDDFVQADQLRDAAASCARTMRATTQNVLRGSFLLLPLLDETGNASYVLGIEGRDLADAPVLLHELHENARHFSQIVHSLTQVVLTATPAGEFDYGSRRWFQIMGISSPEVSVAKTLRQATEGTDFSQRWSEGVQRGERFTFEVPLRTLRGTRWYEVRATPSMAEHRLRKWIVTLDDVHDAVQTRFALTATRKRLQVLADIGSILLDAAPADDDMIRRVLRTAAAAIDAIWLAAFPLDGRRMVVANPSDARMFSRALDALRDQRGATASLRQWNSEAPRPVLEVPMDVGRTGPYGLALVGTPGGVPFNEADVAFFIDVANRISAALRNRAAYHQQERIASALQVAMLPLALPQPRGIAFDVSYRAAESEALVGGDWYDAFELADGRVAFSIGDVAGHGLEAAVVMGRVRETIRVGAMQGMPPGEVLALANIGIITSGQGIVSAFIGYLDPLTLDLEYAAAGHAPPFVVQRDGTVGALRFGEAILGAIDEPYYRTHGMRLKEDTAIVLYTDGLIEFSHDVVSGELRLRNVLSDWGKDGFADPASVLSNRVLDGDAAHDDIALLVVRLKPVGQIEANVPAVPLSSQRARAAISRVLAGAPLGDRSSDFLLAMCEAVNNAIEHGSLSARDTVRFSVSWDAAGARGSVHSRGAWLRKPPNIDRGRGLFLMRALTDRVDISFDGGGTCVNLFLAQPALTGALHA
ncbi:MAG: SpoIIE family protein phosphatase [Candidatus Eremiobacteraeota bacterium]|nr:SpoIIE family protein phosphatase [Candidatus Eremiobacteraeota bacterium]